MMGSREIVNLFLDCYEPTYIIPYLRAHPHPLSILREAGVSSGEREEYAERTGMSAVNKCLLILYMYITDILRETRVVYTTYITMDGHKATPSVRAMTIETPEARATVTGRVPTMGDDIQRTTLHITYFTACFWPWRGDGWFLEVLSMLSSVDVYIMPSWLTVEIAGWDCGYVSLVNHIRSSRCDIFVSA